MTNKPEFSYMISKSDKEILNAFCIVEEIGKEFDSKVIQSGEESKISKLESYDSAFIHTDTDFKASASLNTLTEDSGYPACFDVQIKPDTLSAAFHTDPEDILLQNCMKKLCTMFEMLVEKGNSIKDRNDATIAHIYDSASSFLSENVLKERSIKVHKIVEHIEKISSHFQEIKIALRNKPSGPTLKVNPSYQQFVLHFFQLTSTLIKSIEEDKTYLETLTKNTTQMLKQSNILLANRIQELTAALQRKVDLLIDFQKKVASLDISKSQT